MAADEFSGLIGSIARELLGEPNRAYSSKNELRYGSHGSLSVDLEKGTFYDHESQEGGGCIDFVIFKGGMSRPEALDWMRRHGYLEDRPASGANGANGRRGGGNGQADNVVNLRDHHPQRKLVATYPYLDETGTFLFEVVRFEPKTFRQRRRAENGEWTWAVKGVRLVPYRLPELIEAIGNGHLVFVVEGEKDVDNLRKLGIPATCNAGGVGKWREDLNEHFAGADVVVIADNDPQARKPDGTLLFHEDGRPKLPGQDHAFSVCEALQNVANRVRYLDLSVAWPACPAKGDVSDWIEKASGTAEKLYEIADKAPDWSEDLPRHPADDLIVIVNAFPIDGSSLPRRFWYIFGLLLRGQVTLMVAPPGSGKSLLTLQLAIVCGCGMQEWSGWRPRGVFRSLIINVEEDEVEMRRRLFGAVVKMGIPQGCLDQQVLLAKTNDIVIAKTDHRTKTVLALPMLERIKATIKAHKIDIVVVDPFAETFAGDENSNSELKWAAKLWRDVARECNVSVVLVHHAKKYAQGMAGDMDASRGGGALAGIARIANTLFTMTEPEFEAFKKAERDAVAAEKRAEERRKQRMAAGQRVYEQKKAEQPKMENERWRYLRFDDAKANHSLPSSKARWFYKATQGIGNAGDGLPEDEVGVLLPWKPPMLPDAFADMTEGEANEILDLIEEGVKPEDGRPIGEPYGRTRRGSSNRWVGEVLKLFLQCNDDEAKRILEKWFESGVLVEFQAKLKSAKGASRDCVKVERSKRPGTVIEESFM